MRTSAYKVIQLGNLFRDEIKTIMRIRHIVEIKFTRPFVIAMDVTSASGDDWGTETVVVSHMNSDGTITGGSESGDDHVIELVDLAIHEIAFILDELLDGNYTIEESGNGDPGAADLPGSGDPGAAEQ